MNNESVNAVVSKLSTLWQYGLILNVEPEEILEVKFSCEPIPGMTFPAKGSELKRVENGALHVEKSNVASAAPLVALAGLV